MELLFQHKEKYEKYENTTLNLYLYEQKPQKRTIDVGQYDAFYDDDKSTHVYRFKKRVLIELPYLYFVFNTMQRGDNRFRYGGEPTATFQVFASDKPITSIDEEVGLLMFETRFLGNVCLNHSYDGNYFDSIEELTQWATSEWYGQTQSIDCYKEGYCESKVNILGEKLDPKDIPKRLKLLWEIDLKNNLIVPMSKIWKSNRYATNNYSRFKSTPEKYNIRNAIDALLHNKYIAFYKELS